MIIVSYNQPQLLRNLLSSLWQNCVSANNLARIIIVNTGHPDSLRWVDDTNPAIRLIQAPKNLGWEGGLQLGLQHATAPIVGFLNDDLHITPGAGGWLTRLMEWFTDPDVAAVGPSSNYVMGVQSIFAGGGTVMTVPYLIGFFMLVRRSMLDAVGGVDADRKSTRLNSSHIQKSRMPSSA